MSDISQWVVFHTLFILFTIRPNVRFTLQVDHIIRFYTYVSQIKTASLGPLCLFASLELHHFNCLFEFKYFDWCAREESDYTTQLSCFRLKTINCCARNTIHDNFHAQRDACIPFRPYLCWLLTTVLYVISNPQPNVQHYAALLPMKAGR